MGRHNAPKYKKGEGNPEKWRADHRTQDRKCLRCGKMFYSYHGGHRLCDRCNKWAQAQVTDYNLIE